MPKKKQEIQELTPGAAKTLGKLFNGQNELKNSDICSLFGLENHHAGRIFIMECEARGFLRKTRTTKMAAFYGPGPNLKRKEASG